MDEWMIHTQTDVHQWRWWLRGLFITDKSGVERKSRVAVVVVVYKKKEDVKADARESEVKALPVRVKVNERERIPGGSCINQRAQTINV